MLVLNAIKFILVFAVCVCDCKCDASKCGFSDEESGLIIGGTKTPRGKWPWLVALFVVEENKFFCGATLISDRHILSAAHCLHQKFTSEKVKPSEILAYLGRYELSKHFETDSQIAFPSKILIHPEWDSGDSKYDADISLIFIKNNVIFNSYIIPICLWDLKASPLTTNNGIIAGWGQSDLSLVSKPTNTPTELEVSIVPNDICFLEHFRLTFISSTRTFCGIGKLGSAPCLGDSGGGFFMKQGRNWYLRGIISASLLSKNRTCDVSNHTIYSNIFDYYNWITEETGIQITSVVKAPPIDIITRSMWNANPPGPAVLYLTPPSKRIMISHTVTSECFDRLECIEMMQSIQRNHQTPAVDYNDIYCNFFIGGDGLILEGRGWKVRGEHTVGAKGSHNDAVCIAFIGNFQNHQPKQSMIDAFFKLLEHGVAINMLDLNYVINAQRDFHSSQSPGDAFYNIIRSWPRFRSTFQ